MSYLQKPYLMKEIKLYKLYCVSGSGALANTLTAAGAVGSALAAAGHGGILGGSVYWISKQRYNYIFIWCIRSVI